MKASAVVLAGGRSSRMGVDKALLTLEGRTLLDRTVAALTEVADDIVVVGRTSGRARGVRFLTDETPNLGPLGGLHTGLRQAVHERVICVGCDMPFLNTELLRYLVSILDELDAAVPLVEGMSHPLHAVYSRRCATDAARQIESGDLRLRGLLDRLRVRWVEEPEVHDIDPGHRSVLNINTREEWARVRLVFGS
jgi:molybdopterin-guanine dinucleotide biosynthesis protein A